MAEVKRVTKQASGVIRVQAAYREPFAMVEVDGTAYLLDRNAVRLPVEYVIGTVPDEYWNEWFRIAGVSAAVPPAGAVWPGADLAAGLELVEYLRDATVRGEVSFRSSLRVIDVSNHGRRRDPYDGELRIRTIYPRGYIDWGLPPGKEYTVEASANRKLEMLRALYAERSRLPDLVLDVRGADAIRLREPRGG